MKNSDYVLRFEFLSGVSQANKTNSYSSFFILHFKDSSYQMKFLGVQSYEKRVVSHCFFDFYLEKRKKNLIFAPEIVKRQAQMLESVDKSVSNTDAERRAGSTPALGT